MPKDGNLFHESWHRIAKQRIALRASVQVQRQFFRGKKWYVLHDPFSNNYYRLRPAAYEFITQLHADRTIEEAWEECAERNPDDAAGQGEIIELLAQLYHANLLQYEIAPDSEKLFQRFKKKRQRIVRSYMMNIMFIRIPLFDPDALLNRMRFLIKLTISPAGLMAWLGIVFFGLKYALENFSQLQVQSQGILAPSNLFLLYAGLVIIKTLHEFGHAFTVKRFGGEVHTMGVMFLIFNPLPYMDASAAWTFRSKWKRVLVGASGMLFEVFVAACAMFVWVNTGQGVINTLAYNMVFIASVSTILFNINPLLRFDGYYILSDLLDFPNLHQQSRKHLTFLIEKYAFGCRDAETPATGRQESYLLGIFGVLAFLYRIVVFTTILLFVADRFLLAGIVMTVICAVTWVIVPISKLSKYLASSPKLARNRPRALTVCGASALVIFQLLYILPFPNSFKAPGVLKAVEYKVAVNKTEGYVEEVLVSSGKEVKPGDPIVRLRNPQLGMQIRETRAALVEARAMYQKALMQQQADLKPISERIEFFTKRLQRYEQEEKDLVMTSDFSAMWIAPDIDDYRGMWIARGTPLGQLINHDQFYFISVVPQQEVSRLFSGEIRGAEVKLAGQSGIDIPVSKYKSIPFEQTNLPSSALGWGAGGDVAIDVKDDQGTKSAEPFYEVRASVNTGTSAALLHGRSGKIRFALAGEPLLKQGWRKLRQLIQKRYQI